MLFTVIAGNSTCVPSRYPSSHPSIADDVVVVGGVSVTTTDLSTVSGPTPYSLVAALQKVPLASCERNVSTLACMGSFGKKIGTTLGAASTAPPNVSTFGAGECGPGKPASGFGGAASASASFAASKLGDASPLASGCDASSPEHAP